MSDEKHAVSEDFQAGYRDGYRTAKHFYGEWARQGLEDVAATMTALRAEFPRIPPQVDRHLREIDRAVAARR